MCDAHLQSIMCGCTTHWNIIDFEVSKIKRIPKTPYVDLVYTGTLSIRNFP